MFLLCVKSWAPLEVLSLGASDDIWRVVYVKSTYFIRIEIIKPSMFCICRSSDRSQGAVPTVSVSRYLPLLDLFE